MNIEKFGGLALAILMDRTLSENPDPMRPSLSQRADQIFAQHGVEQSDESRRQIRELEALLSRVTALIDGEA